MCLPILLSGKTISMVFRGKTHLFTCIEDAFLP